MLHRWEITIPQFTEDVPRKAYCYVPDYWEEDKRQRFPVLYMFDAHNVFLDEDATYGKSWGMLEFLEENRVPLIVAGAECNPFPEDSKYGGRLSEYTPFSFKNRYWGDIKARGKETMEWLVGEFKPFIDDSFPTKQGRNNCFIAGSSMGGLMTVYALSMYQDVFSRGAALSPAFDFNIREVLEMIRSARYKNTQLFMDYGEKELKRHGAMKNFPLAAAALTQSGMLLTTRIAPKGEHNEASWEKEIPFFMDVLFDN